MSRVVAMLALAIALLFPPFSSPAAVAAPTTAPNGPETHCVHNLSTGSESCFATFTEAIAAATNGAVTDASAAPAQAVADSEFARRLTAAGEITTASSAILGISWVHANYAGSSVAWTAAYGCDDSTDIDWQISNVGSTWNDKISSAKSFSNCQSKYWQNSWFSGASTSWFYNLSYFGSMNDQATSIQFR
jgi:hypothetical protein